MTTDFICECETHGIQQAVNLMTIHWLRQLPVLSREYELAGIISRADLVHALDDQCLAGPT